MENPRTEAIEAIEVEGKNAEEALQAACDRLNTTPNQVEYEVVDGGGRAGMFGFLKGKTVRVRVWKKTATQRMITELIKGLFTRMGVEAELRVTEAEDGYEVELGSSDADGLLIGRGGETLAALQHIISRMVGQKDEALRVRLDVAGYRKRRHDQLRRKALDLAERALANGRDALTEPLPADERRIVHMALADDKRVETRALGDGLVKRIAICPVGGASGVGGGGERGAGRGRGPRSEESEPRGRESRSDEGAGGESPGGRSRSGGRPRRDSDGGRPPRSGRGGYGRREDGDGGARGPRREESDVPAGARAQAVAPDTRPESSRPPRRPAVLFESEKMEEAPPGQSPGEADGVGADVDRQEYRKPRKASMPEAKESYFMIPPVADEAESKGSEDETPEDGTAAPVTWGRKNRASRGRR